MRNIELRQLHYFLLLSRELHFGRAAALAFITQPALSQQIVKLEEQVGVLLFQRDRRRVQLTPAGEILVKGVEKIFNELDSTLNMARKSGNESSLSLALGMVEYTGLPFIPPALIWLQARYPEVKISRHEMNAEGQIAALISRAIDIGFGVPTMSLPPEEQVVARRIITSHWALLVCNTHPFAHRDSIKVDELAGERLIVPARSVNAPLYDAVVFRCRSAGFTPNFVYETMQAQMGITLVKQGLGIMLGAGYVFSTQEEDMSVVPVEGLDALEVYAFWRAGETQTLVLDFVEYVQREAKGYQETL
ncbi:TPA: LysR family transcriptional regulator [Klebsiella pneumoniae]|nr:LysR family transcriptional regulator [Klebsiella pneumoniae]